MIINQLELEKLIKKADEGLKPQYSNIAEEYFVNFAIKFGYYALLLAIVSMLFIHYEQDIDRAVKKVNQLLKFKRRAKIKLATKK